MSTFAQGTTANIDATYTDGTGNAVTPVSPLVSIIDPNLMEVVSNAVPTVVSTGVYTYAYPLSPTAPLGAWQAVWSGTINGSPQEATDVFLVVEAGSIEFGAGTPVGPCGSWCEVSDLACEPADPDRAALWVAFATEILWALSGRRYGECSALLRPCRGDLVPASGWHEWGTGYRPYMRDVNEWVNVCGHADACSCSDVEALTISPLTPITAVVAVTIDGVTLAQDAYEVDDRRTIRRVDGGRWPTCQDLSVPLGEPGTWSVQINYGSTVPVGGRLAAAALACEFVKAEQGDDCLLPTRIVSLTRLGETVSFIDVQEFLSKGGTGIYAIDLWLNTVNPNRLQQRSSVWSPDLPRQRVVG